MKVLHVAVEMRQSSGVSAFCGELINEMVGKCDSVTLATVRGGRMETRGSDGTTGDTYQIDQQIEWISIDKLFQMNADWDVVHIHGIWPPVLHRVSTWAGRNKIPVVWSPHGMLAPWAMAHKRWKKLLPWWLYQHRDLAQARMLHATSEHEVKWIRAIGFKNPIVIAPLGTRMTTEYDSNASRERVILFVGRIYPVKGIDRLLRAWALMPVSERVGWRIRLVGPDQAGYTGEMESLTRRLGISKEVEFVGPKYGTEMEAEYARAAFLVLPSFSENFGGVVVDALAYGVPVIASEFTPWKELVKAECGWVTSIEPESLVATLREALQTSQVRQRQMGINGRELVATNYRWAAIAEKMLTAYRGVCG